MKKIIICLLVVAGTFQFSCKKFLDITPIDKLTGNNYYKTEQDIEANITDMYGMLFEKYTNTNTAGATGEFRSGEVIPASAAWNSGDRRPIAQLGGHNRTVPNPGLTLGRLEIPAATVVNDRTLLDANGGIYNFQNLRDWRPYYQIIQSANLLVFKLEEGVEYLSAEQSKRYIGEAKFIRNWCYFTMVRLYGDVVYYTDAFHKDAMPRENMISVLNKCITDLKSAANDLPIITNDPTSKGVRATKGAAQALIMNMNMWNAGFDFANRGKYYQETADLGQEIMESGAYKLLNPSEWNLVTKGRSEESIFELFSTANYVAVGNPIRWAPFGEAFIHFPYRLPEYDWRHSPAVFTELYMDKLYPNENDARLTTWFESPFEQNSVTFQMKKFAGNTIIDSSDPFNIANPESTYLMMRYADIILLRAEALAELGSETEAAIELNKIRNRWSATDWPNAQNDYADIKDAIFWERAKELMGEGTRYFDLVRTRKVLNREYTDNPLTPDKFNRGAWTWPINGSALENNQQMVLNTYWEGSGF